MIVRTPAWVLGLALAGISTAQAQVDLSKLDKGMAGPRTQVLVLGSVHLSQLPKDFDPKALDALLDRLAGFKPEIIAIEAIGGEQCDLAARHPSVYGPDYCAATDAAKAATGLDIPAAIAEIDKTLAAWPARPEPAQRRHLAALFLAAEIRNLRMVANIQQTFRERPGARVLSIVGASHKPWFDSWLGQMQGVDIVDAEQVLQ